jgi:alkylhydroperoxidase family enzyme
MTIHVPAPGPYTLAYLGQEAVHWVPELLSTLRFARPGPGPDERVSGRTRLLVWLRLARTLGCPICLGLFPTLARHRGMDDAVIASALAGRPEALEPEQFAALQWTDAIVASGGERPLEVPAPALLLSEGQRERLLFFVRMERVVHATGLMFLPHTWIQGAFEG